MTGSSTPVAADIGGLSADGLDVDGGTGQLVSGAAGGIALDAAPDGGVRVLAADVNGSPLGRGGPRARPVSVGRGVATCADDARDRRVRLTPGGVDQWTLSIADTPTE